MYGYEWYELQLPLPLINMVSVNVVWSNLACEVCENNLTYIILQQYGPIEE